ncbi:MAG: aldehyde dehydrogenase [Synergistaceae bacterium]|nr:aldehyde dehydrogenase [Synergistaceae bacterium]
MERNIDEHLVWEITRRVADILENGGSLYGRVDTAVTASLRAQMAWQWDFSLADRIGIINGARAALTGGETVSELAALSLGETGMGRKEDKERKIRLALERTPGPEFFRANAITGDHGLALEESSPFGVIASFVPSVDPAAVVLSNAINMISGGNSVVFSPHPAAVRTTVSAAAALDSALVKLGAPKGLVSAISAPSGPSIERLMNHRSVSLLCVTGGKDAVSSALRSGKPTVAAGPGNPPIVADETADLRKAARGIAQGCSFDNNASCLGEKALFVVHGAAHELIGYLLDLGAVSLTDPQDVRRLTKALMEGRLTGKSPAHILRAIGVSAPEETKMILVETGETHPLVQEEIMAPVLPMVRVADFEDGLASAVRTEGGLHHSAAIYSTNINNMSVMARAMETSIFTKNAPTFSAIGYNGDCPTAFTIATMTGQGPVTPLSFCRIRRCVLSGAFRIV